VNWIHSLCARSSPTFSAGQALEVADLMAQQQMACWSAFAFLGTVISIVVSAAALGGLLVSLGLTRLSIRENRQLGESGVRAYVHVSRAVHHWTDVNGPYTVLLYLENCGSTPAKKFEVGGRLDKVKLGEVSANIRPGVYPMKAWSGIGTGPPTSVRLDVLEFTELAREFVKLDRDYVILLQGTIRYQDVFDQWFETDFAFYSHTTTPKGRFSLTKLRRPTASNLRSYEPARSPSTMEDK
jgi:hypothetical protein